MMKQRSCIVCMLILVLGCFFARAEKYRVGDVYYNEKGEKEGVVCWIHPDGKGGWMVALNNLNEVYLWGPKEQVPGLADFPSRLASVSDEDGYHNTQLLREFLGEGTRYAAQAADFDEGWYLPAAGQMRKLISVLPLIDSILKENGGVPLFERTRGSEYWTSTSFSESKAYQLYMKEYILVVQDAARDARCHVRLFRNFEMPAEEVDASYTYHWNTGAATPALVTLPQAGKNDYVLTVSAPDGRCSSTAAKSVLVASAGDIRYRDTICKGQRYRRNGFDTDVSGEHPQVLEISAGCSVSVTLELTVADTFRTVLSDHFCRGSVYSKNNFTAYYAGTYVQRWQTMAGCDSLVTLVLEENQAFDTTYADTVCFGAGYRGYGFEVDRVSRDSLLMRNAGTPEGCDSVVRLLLTVQNPAEQWFYDSVCRGESYQGYEHFNLAAVTQDTVCSYRTRSSRGCDSVVWLSLRVLDPPEKWLEASLCEGGVYTAYGFQATESGVYEKRWPGPAGKCDTVIRLHLTVHPVAEKKLRDSVCAGERYTGNPLFDLPPVMKDTLCEVTVPGLHGCDSVVRLSLKVLETPEKWLEASLCEGGVYTAYGFQATESGVYEKHWPGPAGKCDTVIRLHLTVHPVAEEMLRDSVCAGERYTGNPLFDLSSVTGDTLCEVIVPGTYGCDSVVRLYLEWFPLQEKEIQVKLRKGEVYQGYGLNTAEAGYYEVKWPAWRGCDTLVRIKVEIEKQKEPEKQVLASICAGEHYTDYGFDRTEAGRDTIRMEGMNGDPDTLVCLDLQVNPVYELWKKDTICRGEYYRFGGNLYTDAGHYVYRSSTVAGCDSTVHLQLFVGEYADGKIAFSLTDCETYGYEFSLEGNLPATVQFPRYRWTFGGEEAPEGERIRWHFADSGSYPVVSRITSEWKCERVVETEVYVPYYPAGAKLLTDVTAIDAVHPEVSFRTEATAGLRYEWDFGDGRTEESNRFSLSHRYEEPLADFYEVKVSLINALECRTEAFARIRTFRDPVIPNTFSPNGDGINDVFMKDFRVKIVNRNGLVIREGEGGWDGTYKGKQTPEDTYFYEVFIPAAQGERIVTGYITLIR